MNYVGNDPGGLAVYILTFKASNGHNKQSAIASADDEANDQTIFLLLA